MPTILIADDEKNIRATLVRSLRLEGYATAEAENGAQALERIESGDIDLLVLDLQMPVKDGLQVLDALSRSGPRLPVVVLTAHGSIEKAVRAVRLGAFDFIEKPPAVERILLAVSNALRYGRLEEENRRLAEEAGLGADLLGSSPPMRELAGTVSRVAPTDAFVLLLGENGTGKEVVARAIHAASPRRDRRLVTVNCAAIPETLFESELFGHNRGAFTGATEARRGKFQQADGGTLFLDEIGDLPLTAQSTLLRTIQESEVLPVGGTRPERIDLRVVAATHRDVERMVADGTFRHDLLARLRGVVLELIPLRERPEDVALLIASALRKLAPERGDVKLSPEAARALLEHDWPLNVRELEQALAGALALSGTGAILLEHLPEALRPTGEPPPQLTEEQARHRDELIALLREHRGNLSAVARAVGKGRTQVARWVSRYRIDATTYRSG